MNSPARYVPYYNRSSSSGCCYHEHHDGSNSDDDDDDDYESLLTNETPNLIVTSLEDEERLGGQQSRKTTVGLENGRGGNKMNWLSIQKIAIVHDDDNNIPDEYNECKPDTTTPLFDKDRVSSTSLLGKMKGCCMEEEQNSEEEEEEGVDDDLMLAAVVTAGSEDCCVGGESCSTSISTPVSQEQQSNSQEDLSSSSSICSSSSPKETSSHGSAGFSQEGSASLSSSSSEKCHRMDPRHAVENTNEKKKKKKNKTKNYEKKMSSTSYMKQQLFNSISNYSTHSFAGSMGSTIQMVESAEGAPDFTYVERKSITVHHDAALLVPNEEELTAEGFHDSEEDSSSLETVDGVLDFHRMLRNEAWDKMREYLHIVKEQANADDIREMLLNDTTKSTKETILHIACWKAPQSITLLILDIIPEDEMDQYLLALDREGNTPLHSACANLDERASFAVIKAILVRSPLQILDVVNEKGDTPLHLLMTSPGFEQSHDITVEIAAEEAITYLLSMAPHLGTAQNKWGATLLHGAIANGCHERVLMKLIAMAPEAARVMDIHGMLPLHYVASFVAVGKTIPWTFAAQLVNVGGLESISVQTKNNGDTPLHLLVTNARAYVEKNKVKFVDRNTTKLTELLVGTGDERLSPLLISNFQNFTPLHCCAVFDTPPQLTRICMESPLADTAVSITTPEGATPLHLLMARETVGKALENVTSLARSHVCTKVNQQGQTPLIVAVLNKHVDSSVIKTLTKAKKKSVWKENTEGLLPLHVALTCKKPHKGVIKELLKSFPAGVSATTPDGDTALHFAAKRCSRKSIIELLVDKYPAALGQRNEKGELPLDCAMCSNPKMVQLLESYTFSKSYQRRQNQANYRSGTT